MRGLSRDDVIRMAREAGIETVLPAPLGQVESIEHFANLVAAAEREACAKLCDEHKNPIDDPMVPVGQYEGGGYITAEFLADAIRARGQSE